MLRAQTVETNICCSCVANAVTLNGLGNLMTESGDKKGDGRETAPAKDALPEDKKDTDGSPSVPRKRNFRGNDRDQRTVRGNDRDQRTMRGNDRDQ